MHNNIIMCFFVLVVVSVFFSMSSATDVYFVGVAKSITLPHPRPPQDEQTTPKDDDVKRRKRSIFSTNRTVVANKVNSLRRSVGASDMNYLTYSTVLETDIAIWTGYCDFDAHVYTRQPAYVVYAISTLLQTYDQIEVLEEIYSDPKFFNKLRSIYLQSVGAYTDLCLSAISEGIKHDFVYVNVYVFGKTSYFKENLTQFTLGNECTTCQSGSYWCYEGLCRDDCSDSNSDCYCNSNCLNCAATDSTTCRCRCPGGWSGPRCETANGVNTTTPTCSATPRIPRTSTTSTTSTRTTTTRRSNAAASRNSASVSSIGKSMFRLGFHAAVALLLRICTVFI